MRTTFALLAVLPLAVATSAFADPVYATGFESPNFTTGALTGQHGIYGSGGVVENTLSFGGNQAVRYSAFVDPAGQSVNYVSAGTPVTASQVLIQDEVYVTATTGILAFDAIAADSSTAYLGQIIIQNGAATLGLASSDVGSVAVAANTWYTYDLLLDYNTDTVYGYVDGDLIGSGAFAAANQTNFGAANFGINYAGPNALGSEYVDNLVITETPEPSSLLLAGSGLLALGGVVRRKAKRS